MTQPDASISAPEPLRILHKSVAVCGSVPLGARARKDAAEGVLRVPEQGHRIAVLGA